MSLRFVPSAVWSFPRALPVRSPRALFPPPPAATAVDGAWEGGSDLVFPVFSRVLLCSCRCARLYAVLGFLAGACGRRRNGRIALLPAVFRGGNRWLVVDPAGAPPIRPLLCQIGVLIWRFVLCLSSARHATMVVESVKKMGGFGQLCFGKKVPSSSTASPSVALFLSSLCWWRGKSLLCPGSVPDRGAGTGSQRLFLGTRLFWR